jgi:hypothetical protein
MAHLVCDKHGSRSMVLQSGVVVHRNGQTCDAHIVWWGDRDFVSFDVPTRDGLSTATDSTYWAPENLDFSAISKSFNDGLHKMTDQFKKMGAVISEGAKTIAVVLPNLLEYTTDVEEAQKPYFEPHLPPVNLWNREEALLRAIFGKFEDVTRDTTLGTAHITSTSEGLSADVVPKSELRKQTEADDEAYRAFLRRKVEPDIREVKCPVCGEKAIQDRDQEDTIYCDNCEFMGMYPETTDHQNG